MAYTRGAPVIAWSAGFLPFIGMYHIVLALVRVYGRLVHGVRFRGRQNLSRASRAVVVSNHTLLVDPGLIAHAIRPRRTYFTMLEETALIPWLGTFVRLLGAVPIPEGPGSLRILDGAARTALATLGLIHFFPEGELYLENQRLQPFHPGAFLLAARLGVPVIPVTTVLHQRLLRGRAELRLLGRQVRLPPRVTVVIGAPIPATAGDHPVRDARAMAARVRALMQRTIDERGGCKGIFRGMMPRLVKSAERQSA